MDQARNEKSHLERSIKNLTFQRDSYLRDLQKNTYLQEVRKVLTPFNFLGYAGSQVVRLVRMIEKNSEALDFALKDLEFLHCPNASLTQKLKECASLSLGEATGSFENMVQQVEHFHSSLVVSRKHIWPG